LITGFAVKAFVSVLRHVDAWQTHRCLENAQLRITERIRLMRPDILWDEITIVDSQMLERPWTVTFAYQRMPDYEMLEYVCEDNREYADESGVTRLRLGDGQ
jgi:hypothetical protein